MKVYCRIAQDENTKQVHRANFSMDFEEIVVIEEFFNEECSNQPMTIINDYYVLEHPFDEIHSDWMHHKKTYPIFN